MVKEGIIDPTKVVRSALQNAASVATLLLTSDALVADMPKKEEKPAAAAAGRHVLNKRFHAKTQRSKEAKKSNSSLPLMPFRLCVRSFADHQFVNDLFDALRRLG